MTQMIESHPKPSDSGRHSPLPEDQAGPPVVGRLVPECVGGGDPPAEPLGRFGHNKVGILATLFLVSGIVGLPLLLLSPAFSRPEKGFWTVAIIIYTAIVFSLFGGFLLWVWSQIGG